MFRKIRKDHATTALATLTLSVSMLSACGTPPQLTDRAQTPPTSPSARRPTASTGVEAIQRLRQLGVSHISPRLFRGTEATIEVELYSADADTLSSTTVEAVVGLDSEPSERIEMRQAAPGRFSALIKTGAAANISYKFEIHTTNESYTWPANGSVYDLPRTAPGILDLGPRSKLPALDAIATSAFGWGDGPTDLARSPKRTGEGEDTATGGISLADNNTAVVLDQWNDRLVYVAADKSIKTQRTTGLEQFRGAVDDFIVTPNHQVFATSRNRLFSLTENNWIEQQSPTSKLPPHDQTPMLSFSDGNVFAYRLDETYAAVADEHGALSQPAARTVNAKAAGFSKLRLALVNGSLLIAGQGQQIGEVRADAEFYTISAVSTQPDGDTVVNLDTSEGQLIILITKTAEVKAFSYEIGPWDGHLRMSRDFSFSADASHIGSIACHNAGCQVSIIPIKDSKQ